MNCLKAKAAIAILLAIASIHTASAQNNTLGTSWSFSGIGVTYERNTSENTFAHIAVQAEMGEMFRGTTPYSGMSAAFTWNHIFAQAESRDGTPVHFFAGPGIAAGASKDFNGPRGLFIGLKGRVGARCSFDRNIDLAVGVAPVLGLHRYVGQNKNAILKCYNNGILQTLMPEIVIAYRF